ncbi:hypothetical protein OHA21_43785 [Actinoplanes sp. NBC_00393]|uniref:hypothetical protein n=1 Tax=Actinoplanes sp. NBC_00393 TaxID=2975953 RepID=UPI002E229C8B
MSHVRITGNATGTQGTIDIDGHQIANMVRGFALYAEVGQHTTLDLQVFPRGVSEYDGEAFVRLNSDFEAFLVHLGWTPPHRP